jgi:uncharacterized membrane protein YqiK
MPRIAVLIVVILVIIGALFFLSTLPRERPTTTIETPVAQPSGGNAH